MGIRVEPLTGAALGSALAALARLRIEVFRAFPYLYDGTEDSERLYLEKFAKAEGSVIVAARDGAEIIGAATGAPLVGHADEFAAPFEASGYDLRRIFYFGESVLRSSYRGQGTGHRFFDEREAHARRLGSFTHAAFCAVVRPEDHPLRPGDYASLDPFWRKRGYAKVPGLVAQFSWKEIGEAEPTPKPMQFWMRTL